MTTISKQLSESDNLTNPKSIAIDAMEYTDEKNEALIPSYSLAQGKKFEAYQKKVTFNLDKQSKDVIEGFRGRRYEDTTQSTSGSGLTAQSKSLLQETDISSYKQTIENLKEEYKSTLKDYKDLQKRLKHKVKRYVERVDPNNPYLNKTVRFTTSHIAYVTNKGVVKFVPTMDIWATTGIPTTYIDLNIPWKDSYSTPGTLIESTPPLVSGTFLELNQTIGNEGANVFVDTYLSDSVVSDAKYQGCYADNVNSPLMSFIGGAPPQPSVLQNGNFENPQIANDSYQRVSVPGWSFNGDLMKNSNAWGYPMPYPTGSQAACIQGLQSLSQSIFFQAGVKYTLSFDACG